MWGISQACHKGTPGLCPHTARYKGRCTARPPAPAGSGTRRLGMALSWALAALSLLPLLDAQSPGCANLTARPITNATLEQVRPWAPECPGLPFLLLPCGQPLGLVLSISLPGPGATFRPASGSILLLPNSEASLQGPSEGTFCPGQGGTSP